MSTSSESTRLYEDLDEIEVYVVMRDSPLGQWYDLATVSQTPDGSRAATKRGDLDENYPPVTIRKMRLVR